MYKVTSYPHGAISWADCNSTNWSTSKEFYIKVMGWQPEDIPIGDGHFYTMLKQDGETVGAVSAMQADMQAQGVPSHWSNYISVDDVDALQAKVTELGGTVIVPPMDVFDSGRMMMILDPTGAAINLWQAKNHIGAGLVNTVGAMMWNELMTTDPQKAMDFYGALLGWTFQKMDEQDYYVILNNGRMNGGIFPLAGEMANMPPAWMVYYNVADLKASVEKVKSNGGSVHVEGNANGVGDFALVADPAGSTFYIMEAKNVDTWDLN
ncbi:MAG: VOC family protein [Phototrophicaceae bacterium]